MTRLEYRTSVKHEGRGSCDVIAIDRVLPDSKVPQGLEISFHRTIRVPDNEQVFQLPPNLGSFPLYKIQDYASSLPQDMVEKDGVFFPMYQKEAMWIRFKANAPFMIKIYCGGVNAVSGEHGNEDAETKQRRLRLAQKGESTQDYVVVPSQPWLDGVAVKPSVVRQFVAMPLGQGYSVEAQLTGKEVIGGLQFEVTPALCEPKDQRNPRPPKPLGDFHFFIKTLTGKTVVMPCSPEDTIDSIKIGIQEKEGIPPEYQRLIFAGRQLEPERTVASYGIQHKSTVYLVLTLRGGGPDPVICHQLGLAAGGMIKQDIRQDTCDPAKWIQGLTLTIPVQILNSAVFRQVTGTEPPDCPISAETYAEAGFPFFELFEEKPSNISGADAFGSLQSINNIEMARGLAKRSEAMVHPRVAKLGGSSLGTTVWDGGDVFDIQDPDGLLSPHGPRRDFRTLADLEQEIKELDLGAQGK